MTFAFRVGPTTHSGRSIVLERPDALVAGRDATVIVQARDPFSNNRDSADDKFVVRVYRIDADGRAAAGEWALAHQGETPSGRYRHDGIRVDEPGLYEVQVRLGSALIDRGMWQAEARPGVPGVPVGLAEVAWWDTWIDLGWEVRRRLERGCVVSPAGIGDVAPFWHRRLNPHQITFCSAHTSGSSDFFLCF